MIRPPIATLLRWLGRAPRPAMRLLSISMVAGAGAADWFSGADVAFTLVYLLPIALVAWFLGRVEALVVAIVSAATWLFVDLATQQFELHPAVVSINLAVQLLIFALFGELLAALRERVDVESRLARTDPLTGLENRRAFWDDAERELERCRRFGQPFSLAYLDVDGFKGVNDRLGHRRGDELLQAIGRTLRAGVRRIDTVARIGGDEFALLLPGTHAAGAAIVVDKLREELGAAEWQRTFAVECSIGCITVIAALEDVDALVARADALMYAMKRAGHGRLQHEVVGSPAGGAVR